jgi:hypothetical protein
MSAPAPAPVAAVQARITSLREMWAPAPALDASGAVLTPPDEPAGFDAFGPAYQAALELAAASAPAPTVQVAANHLGAVGAPLTSGASGTILGVSGASLFGSWSGGIAGVGSVGVPLHGTGSSVGRIGGYGRLTPPAELAAYGNGRIPAEALVPIGQGGHRLHAPAAAAWRSLVDAAAADGVTVRITDSYRSFEQQVDLAARKGLYRDGGYAAVPGTSNHGWGLAVDADVNDPATLAWLRANAHRFGFVEAVPREPWHWEYRPEQA